MDAVLTTEEAARFLKLHPHTVLKLAREKRLPVAKLGRAWRFRRVDLEEFLAKGGEAGNAPDALDMALLQEAERVMADPDEEFVPYEQARAELGL